VNRETWQGTRPEIPVITVFQRSPNTAVPREVRDDALFRRVIGDELAGVQKSRAVFKSSTVHGLPEAAILFFCLLVNLAFLVGRHDYLALFIAASFYLNMFYFITLLIPTSPGAAGLPKAEIRRFLSWLREIGLKGGTSQFTRLFINAFFINSRALSLGIGLIFSVDIVFTLFAYLFLKIPAGIALIVAAQCAIIAVFYLLVWKMEPFSSRFAKNVEKMKTQLSKNFIPSWVVSALFMLGFFLIVILFLTTIILLPGITVATFLSGSGLEALGHLVLLIALLAVSQYFIIRYFHGISSRLMAERLFEYKETALRGLIEREEKNQETVPVPAENPYETTTLLLESKIYQVRRISFFGTFPVYIVDLDFSVMLDSTTLTAIRGYIQEAGP